MPQKASLELKLKVGARKTANKIIVLSIISNSCFLQVIFFKVVVYWELSVLKILEYPVYKSADIIHRYLISFKDNYYKFLIYKIEINILTVKYYFVKKSKDGRDFEVF
jgi:hypothetical protein